MLRLVREPLSRAPRSCLFVDRDGVLNEHIKNGYVLRWTDFVWRQGAVSSLARLAEVGLPIVIVTNQSCIGRGMVSSDTIRAIMARMVDVLDQAGARISAWYCCPHSPTDGCDCRKPLPGMLYAAAADLNLDLASSYLIGDSETDTAAGSAAGCATFQISDPADLSAAIREVVLRERLIFTPHEVTS